GGEQEVAEVEGADDVGAELAGVADVGVDEPDAGGDLGAGGGEVVAAGPGERLGVEVDADRAAPWAASGPLGGEVGGAAEVLAEDAGHGSAHLGVDALDELDVVGRAAYRLLVEV